MTDIGFVRTGARDDAPATEQGGTGTHGAYGRASLAAQLAPGPELEAPRVVQAWEAEHRLAPFPPLVRVAAWAGINALAWGGVALGAWWLLA